jgi:hypothetical protein
MKYRYRIPSTRAVFSALNASIAVMMAATYVCVALVSDTGSADELTTVRHLKPSEGTTFSIGAKAALAYFSSENGKCNAVVVTSTPPSWDNKVATFETTKYEAEIPSGKTSHVALGLGSPIELTCQTGAKLMDVSLASGVPQ